MSELMDWLTVCQAPSLYAKAGRLIRLFGGIEALLSAGRSDFIASGCSVEVADRIIRERAAASAERLLARLEAMKVGTVLAGKDGYPRALEEIFYPPHLLFVRGRAIAELRDAVAVVGSRRATAYGRSMAESLAKELSAAGLTVVSGMARGIDAAAHRGALGERGGTAAVLGCGLDVAYPKENRRLIEEVAEEGWILSEYPPGMRPLKSHFPARNRIIAGLSRGVVVVEAAEKSGAMITVDFALEQGKDVFAVPGSARSPQSRGANALLKQGAHFAEEVDDVLEVLGFDRPVTPEEDPLSETERALLDRMEWESVHVDELARLFGGAIEVSSILTVLEIKGFAKRDHGGMYLRLR